MEPPIQEIIRQVEELATRLVEDEGFELWGTHLITESGRRVLRVTLECENGISLDDCTRVHRQLSDLLDVHDLIPRRYTLEVSSPGINRPLLRPSHYQRSLGQPIWLQVKVPQDERRVFAGSLYEVEENGVSLVDREVGRVHIAWEDIARARVDLPPPIPSKDPQKKKRKSRRRELRKKLCNQTWTA